MSDEDDSSLEDLLRFEASLRSGNAAESDDGDPRDDDSLKRCLELLDAYRQVRTRIGSVVDPSDAESVPLKIGPYRVQARLGMGASGVVYLAENPDPDRKVAVNLLRPEGLLFTELRQRFEREAEILRQLRHPHIAEILDAGEH